MALPAGPVVAWTIAAVVVTPTIIIRSRVVRPAIIPAVVGAAVVSAVIGLRVVGWTEVIEQERERKRNTETHALGPGRKLRENQRANREQKNQQLFHFGVHLGELTQTCHKPAEKGSSERRCHNPYPDGRLQRSRRGRYSFHTGLKPGHGRA
jgi:hypothetical protein